MTKLTNQAITILQKFSKPIMEEQQKMKITKNNVRKKRKRQAKISFRFRKNLKTLIFSRKFFCIHSAQTITKSKYSRWQVVRTHKS